MIVLGQVRCTEMVEHRSEVRSGQSVWLRRLQEWCQPWERYMEPGTGAQSGHRLCTSQTRPITGARLIRDKVLAFQKAWNMANEIEKPRYIQQGVAGIMHLQYMGCV